MIQIIPCKKRILLSVAAVLLTRLRFTAMAMESDAKSSIYDFRAKTIEGEEISLGKYKGHVCVIVNVASKCGYTKKHYEELNDLYDKYGETKGLRILAFPCNQFGKQEPGDSEEICTFASKRNVKFDIFEKVDVNGADAHPLWEFLKQRQGGTMGDFIKWNFTKFVVDKSGQPVARFGPNTNPSELLPTLQKYWEERAPWEKEL